MSIQPHEVLLAEPRGFCAGVDRAIEIVERALKKFGAPIYVRHEIVHNTYVVNDLKSKGAIFIEDLADVATAPVTKPDRLAVVTQTTLSVDDAAEILTAVKARFPKVREPKKQDICYATQNRQDAVKFMAPQVDVVIVVGSPTSSNSNRLRELAERLGTPAYMVDAAEDLQEAWLEDRPRVGLTAGASAPEVLVNAIVDQLKALGALSVRKLAGVEETIEFPLPKGLGDRSMAEVSSSRS